MIAVRLSAQCTDARVNLVTPGLFARFPTLEAFADADIADVEECVRSCGFYKHKARDIVLACQMLRDEYGGKVPDNMDDLLRPVSYTHLDVYKRQPQKHQKLFQIHTTPPIKASNSPVCETGVGEKATNFGSDLPLFPVTLQRTASSRPEAVPTAR